MGDYVTAPGEAAANPPGNVTDSVVGERFSPVLKLLVGESK